jgi:hypothetical protein
MMMGLIGIDGLRNAVAVKILWIVGAVIVIVMMIVVGSCAEGIAKGLRWRLAVRQAGWHAVGIVIVVLVIRFGSTH